VEDFCVPTFEIIIFLSIALFGFMKTS